MEKLIYFIAFLFFMFCMVCMNFIMMAIETLVV